MLRRPTNPVRLLGIAIFALWVIGPIPILLFTPVREAVESAVLGWRVFAPPPIHELPPLEPSALDNQEEQSGTSAELATSPTPITEPSIDKALGAADPMASPIELLPPTPTPFPGDRYAVLLMGYGGPSHDGGFLTDSMIVVLVDPARKRLTLLSVPRDAWVPMSFDGKSTIYGKINSAYAWARDPAVYPERLAQYKGDRGPGMFAVDTVSRVLGVPIRYYVALDFAGFRQMIDAVGGVDIDVPRAFGSSYPANDNPAIDPSWIWIRFKGGPQRMDGEQAIRYARARNADEASEGTDFARSRRQRLIIEAFKTRLLQPTGVLRTPQLMAIGAKHVDSNYDLPGAAQLGELLLDWRGVEFHQAALTSGDFLIESTGYEGAYVLVPRQAGRSWAAVWAFARRLWDDPGFRALTPDKAMADLSVLPDSRAPSSTAGIVRFGMWVPLTPELDGVEKAPASGALHGVGATPTPAPFGTALAGSLAVPAPASIRPIAGQPARPGGPLGPGPGAPVASTVTGPAVAATVTPARSNGSEAVAATATPRLGAGH